jgi:predicted TIM-barrel fold metal-dependent hydrolase
MRIWDLHCHPTGFGGKDAREDTAEMLRLGDLMGIERFCIYLGKTWQYDPTPAELRQANDYILECLKHARDRAFGFAYLSPNHVDASLAEIDRCIANGPMVGIKLWVARRCSDTAVDPIIRRAAELKAVIFQHTWTKVNGQLPGESIPQDVAVLAARHPDTPIICGHTGAQWEPGIRAIRPLQLVSADLAGSDPTNGMTELAVKELGAERVIYGSDAGGRSLASQLAKVFGANITEAQRELILGENLRRLMRPILTAKGIQV